jgi:hypothetical protein
MSDQVSHEELTRLLDYNPETGVFVWKALRCGVRRGSVAGSLDPRMGYIRINLCGRLYLAHRLAWFYVTGRWPANEIDHADRDKANNRIANLREATRSENQQNKPTYRNNRSGVKGVHWHKQHRKYLAAIQRNGKKTHLGLFTNLSDAAEAYRTAALAMHGQFASCA